MTFQDLAALMYPELHTFLDAGAAAEPAVRMLATGLLRGLQGTFGIRMRNYLSGVFGLPYGFSMQVTRPVMARRPDVVRNLGGWRGEKNGIMRIHDPKVSSRLCQRDSHWKKTLPVFF